MLAQNAEMSIDVLIHIQNFLTNLRCEMKFALFEIIFEIRLRLDVYMCEMSFKLLT